MNYEEFTQKEELMENVSPLERKTFYADVLAQHTEKDDVRLMAYFHYALLFYRGGDFRAAREILEPFVIDYQSYPYRAEIIACFNLMGVAAYCEQEYALARFYIREGLKIARANQEASRYSYEYNNLAVTYLAQREYPKALDAIRKAEENLPYSDDQMSAYVYRNKSEICCQLDQLEEAKEAFRQCEEHDGFTVLPQDTLMLGMLLYYKLGDAEQYEHYTAKVWEHLPNMEGEELITAARIIFGCSMDAGDTAQIERIFAAMDEFLAHNPQEIQIGLQIESLRYDYAKSRGDTQGMLAALEKKELYYPRVLAHAEEARVQDIDRYLRIGQRLQKALASEANANRAKTQFLSNMSHDIRTPINGIMGMLAVIDSCRKDDAKVDDCLAKIDVSARHLLSLVNDVLDMSKLESDHFEIEKKPFDLGTTVDEVEKITGVQAEQAELHLYTDWQDVHGVRLLGSALQLRKILVNLYSNAIKYNKPNGSIYTSLREVQHTGETVTYEFKIRDTGIGMTQDFIDHHLFEAFAQGDNAGRSRYGGTGLGMSIVGQLVKKMNGTIAVESTLGEGTCITVTLPFAIDHNPPADEKTAQPTADLHGKRLLVVEDNELNMEIAEFMLKSAGAVVTKAADGSSAVRIFAESAPGSFDAILMDLMMPVMDGYAATRAIRASDHLDAAEIPIIAMSANAYAEDVEKCLKAGMNAHISKPLFKDVMLNTIAKFV